ncbi:uncharacterized protein METZ01_LOCUS225879, partial [marine metagenome]
VDLKYLENGMTILYGSSAGKTRKAKWLPEDFLRECVNQYDYFIVD